MREFAGSLQQFRLTIRVTPKTIPLCYLHRPSSIVSGVRLGCEARSARRCALEIAERRDDGRVQQIDDAALWAALQVANVPVLLVMLAQLTGDQHWIRPPYTPTRSRGMDDNDSGGLSAPIQDEVRRAVYDIIRRGGHEAEVDVPSPEALTSMMTCCMGEPIPPEYGTMMLEEMGLRDRQPEWPARPSYDALAAFRVGIIGAGISGICAAIALDRAGIPFTIFERSSSFGGTWFDNSYPGCGVDTPSHLYSFSFARWNWSRYFAGRDEIWAYLEHCIDASGIRRSILLQTEVLAAEFDESTDCWSVQVHEADGNRVAYSFNALISGVGQLNEPGQLSPVPITLLARSSTPRAGRPTST